MWHMGGVEGGKVQNHWQMTDPQSGDRPTTSLSRAAAHSGGRSWRGPHKVLLEPPADAAIHGWL